jgi:hypothetical protein
LTTDADGIRRQGTGPFITKEVLSLLAPDYPQTMCHCCGVSE